MDGVLGSKEVNPSSVSQAGRQRGAWSDRTELEMEEVDYSPDTNMPPAFFRSHILSTLLLLSSRLSLCFPLPPRLSLFASLYHPVCLSLLPSTTPSVSLPVCLSPPPPFLLSSANFCVPCCLLPPLLSPKHFCTRDGK